MLGPDTSYVHATLRRPKRHSASSGGAAGRLAARCGPDDAG